MNFAELMPYASAGACVLAAAALLFCVYLRFLLRREIQQIRIELTPDNSISDAIDSLRRQVERLETRVDELDQRRGPSFEWVPEPASLNLNRRGQVLRLHRRGDSIPQIAATLGLSQGEVELMVKVQEMAVSAARKENVPETL